MADIDISTWPVALQYAALVGGGIAGAVVYMFGIKGKKGSDDSTDRTQAKLDLAEMQIALGKVLEAHRESIENRFRQQDESLKGDFDRLWSFTRSIEQRVRDNENNIHNLIIDSQRSSRR